MNDADAMIERWVASWHDPDPERRRITIDELWAADCAYRNARAEFTGRDGLQDAVTAAHEKWVTQGYVFRLARVDRNHDAIRYVWEMVPGEGGEPASVGTHFAMVDHDGSFDQRSPIHRPGAADLINAPRARAPLIASLHLAPRRDRPDRLDPP